MTTTATRTRGTEPPRAGGARPFTGAARLLRFVLRRDRVRIPAWIAGITLATVGTASSFTQTYPTADDRQTIAATLDSPAAVAMTGTNPAPDAYTYGAMLTHQMLWFSAVLVALMSVLLVVRHTRTEEATGRAELVRAGVVGRHAGTVAAFVSVAVTNVALAFVLAAALAATGIESVDWAGSLLYGAAHAAVGLVFAAVAAVTVQLTEYPRGAAGMGIAAIGLAYMVRAVGDVGGGTLSWLSPLGWAQATRAYVDNRWWPLLLAVAATAVLGLIAMALSTRRDVGAGLRPPRRGSAHASAALVHPLGFALRLHRAGLVGWSVGVFVLGAMYGSVLGEAEQWLADLEALGEFLPDIAGAGAAETFAGMVTGVMAIIASASVVLAVQKLRSEESGGRLEPVLATGLSRTRWAASHLVVAALGAVIVLLAGGLGIGLAGAAAVGDAGLAPRLVAASLAYTPALWLTAAIGALLYGLASRAVVLAWAVVGYGFVVFYLGGVLRFPDWVNNLSPFGHVPRLPAEDAAALPLLGLTALAVALAGAGIAAFRRRDLSATA